MILRQPNSRQKIEEYSKGGVGNFIECLGYRVRGGDAELENHLKTCSKNANYISKTCLPRMSLIYFHGKFTKKVLIEDKMMLLVKT